MSGATVGSRGSYRDVDWANTAAAQSNRRVKAERLAAAAAWCGALDVTELIASEHGEADADVRAAVLAGAGIRSASDTTWAVVAEVLTDLAPTVLAPGQTPACACRPHPVTGVLYERFLYPTGPDNGHGPDSDDPQPTSGWLCRHGGRAPEPAPDPTSSGDAAAGEWRDPMEGWDDGREPSWDDVAAAAGMVTGMVAA